MSVSLGSHSQMYCRNAIEMCIDRLHPRLRPLVSSCSFGLKLPSSAKAGGPAWTKSRLKRPCSLLWISTKILGHLGACRCFPSLLHTVGSKADCTVLVLDTACATSGVCTRHDFGILPSSRYSSWVTCPTPDPILRSLSSPFGPVRVPNLPDGWQKRPRVYRKTRACQTRKRRFGHVQTRLKGNAWPQAEAFGSQVRLPAKPGISGISALAKLQLMHA